MALDELLKMAESEVLQVVPKVEQISPQLGFIAAFDDTGMDRNHVSEVTQRASAPNLSVRRFVREHPSVRLHSWSRHDWRTLEQCFIDERRRTARTREPFEVKEVVRLYLEAEELSEADCALEWHL